MLRPLQRPHPPFWYGLRGDHGPMFAAQRGMNGVTLGPDERIGKILQAFRENWASQASMRKQFNSPVQSPFVGAMRAMFVADSDAEAERIARKAHETWFDNLAWLWKVRGTFPPIAIAADFDQARASGTLVVGSPNTVRNILTAQAERCRYNYLVLLLAFGSLTHEQQMRSLQLFQSEIMPALKGLNADPAPAARRAPRRPRMRGRAPHRQSASSVRTAQ